MRTNEVTLALLALTLLGCQSGSVPVGHEDHRFDDGAPVDLGTAPWRARRRMDVDQLDDAARDVCVRLADREAGVGRAYDGEPQGIFAPANVAAADDSPAVVAEALASLLVRFHGRRLEPDDPQLVPWIELHGRLADAVADRDPPAPQRAWSGVCIALVTHPDFYTY